MVFCFLDKNVNGKVMKGNMRVPTRVPSIGKSAMKIKLNMCSWSGGCPLF